MRATRRLVALLAPVLLLAAGDATAQSSTGFKLSVTLENSPSPTLHWLALPYHYAPDDVGTLGTLDAEDLCQDLGDSIAAVLRWDEASSIFVEHACGDKAPYALAEGIGYGIRLLPDHTFFGVVTGGHDDGFAYTIPPSGGSQLTWLSVPYHLRAPDRHPGWILTAEDLCRQIGDTEVVAILRWNRGIDAYETYGCGSDFIEPFELVRGEAYGVVNRPDETIEWQPIHH